MHDEGPVELAFQVQFFDEYFADAAAAVLVGQDRGVAGGGGDRGGARGAELCVGGEIRGPDVVESVIDAQVEALDIEARAGRRGIDLRPRGVLILQAGMADSAE